MINIPDFIINCQVLSGNVSKVTRHLNLQP